MRRVGTIIVLTATLAVSFSSAALAVSDTDNATTQVVVDASITLTGIPASIDFGNGVPGDVKNAPAITAKVTTNNLLGYSLNVTTSALTGATAANSYTIGAGRINYAVTTSVTGAVAVGGAGSPDGTVLATKASASGSGGDDFNVAPSLNIPFVNSDTYNGTAQFVASTL